MSIILELHAVRNQPESKRPPSNQGVLIDQFIAYMEWDRGNKFSDEEKKQLHEGLCHGFSVVHSYMAATQKLIWWNALLEEIKKWDSDDTASLKKEITLPDEQQDKKPQEKTLDYHFKRAVNYVLFYQGVNNQEMITTREGAGYVFTLSHIYPANHNQYTTLAENGFGFDQQNPIKFDIKVGGAFTKDQLKKLLQPEIFSLPNTIFLFHHSHSDLNTGHACTIRYCDSHWHYYDPNDLAGEKKFSDIDSLCEVLIQKTYGALFEIEIASFDPTAKEKCKPLTDAYDQLISNPTELLKLSDNGALLEVLSGDISRIEKILALADDSKEIRDAIASFIKQRFISDSSRSKYICIPDQYRSQLRELAKKDNNLRDAIIHDLAYTNEVFTKEFVESKLSKMADKDIMPLVFTVSEDPAISNRFVISAYQFETSTSQYKKIETSTHDFYLPADKKTKDNLKASLAIFLNIKIDNKKSVKEHMDTRIRLWKNTTIKKCDGMINNTASLKHKLEALRFLLGCRLVDYQARVDKKESSGYLSGLFGKHFSAAAKLNATEKMISAIEESLKTDPPTLIDDKNFGAAASNAELGKLLEKLQAVNAKMGESQSSQITRKPG